MLYHLGGQFIVDTLIEFHFRFCRREIPHIHIINLFKSRNEIYLIKIYVVTFSSQSNNIGKSSFEESQKAPTNRVP